MQAMRSDLGTITETVKNNSDLTAQEKSDLIEKLIEADALVEDVTESSSAAVLVLNDLINYDKIENKTLVIEAKQVSPVTLVTSTVRTLQVQAKQANVKLQLLSNFKDESSELFELVRRDMCIIGDSMKLSQVIRNVVSNALKFSATGETVTVTGELNSGSGFSSSHSFLSPPWIGDAESR
jgi:signal transduction histidine kinase